MWRYIPVVLLTLLAGAVQAQTISANEYYQQARRLAFEEKKTAAARDLCAKALQQDASFTEARIFMGRLYAWEQQYDTARQILDAVIGNAPQHEDALLARTDVAYWDKQYAEALRFCEQALQYHPKSTELLLRKGKIYFATQAYDAAKKAADAVLQQDAGNTEARKLANTLKDYTHRNKAGIGYQYFYFNKQFAQPWHIGHVEYSRLTKAGSFTGRFSYGSRYNVQGWQAEAEGYPRISRHFYSYVNIGFSGINNYVFPRFRSGLSVFAALPKAWELEGGIRYLQFDDHTLIYTGSVGKYLGRYWFNAKTFITPRNNRVAHSYFLTTRYYYAKADDYVTLSLGRGISPDENRNVQINMLQNLTSYQINTGIHHRRGSNILYANIGWSKDEYLPKTYGQQVNVAVGVQKKF